MAKLRLKAARDYEFVKKGRGSAVLQRKNDGGGASATFSCTCHVGAGTPGTCKVVIEPDGSSISCEKDTCGGECKWSVNLPGLSGKGLVIM